jgi:restriction endonuclease S subunit
MTSVETFKTAVIRIRDILRGPGVSITGMDSMRHICLYLLSRYMTRAKVASLEVPEEFAWETLIDDARTKNGGVQKALDCFYHAEEDCLVRHFDRLFGTDKFSFDIKNPQKHKEILEILNHVNMKDVDCQMDILGWVYEQHLRTGSSAARDLGQFFTDRFICEYMTELCKPGFKSPGVPESVCDPSMGTGGFLTAFIKYFKKHHADKPIDWSIHQKEIHGCDTDPKVAGVSRLNLFMETGGTQTTNLITHDSLYGDLTQTGYDVILANMPFGLKGIKHTECCERVKDLNIRGTKSEPLFLQLMMVSLNMGGRCAVVVPDGMMVNSSSCHNDTRKYLLDNFDLKRVIKMKGQFFMNTGIQPSILFFEKTGTPTEAVEFWEVVKGDKGDITETMVVSVPRTKIEQDKSYSLDLRRYLEAEVPVANPAGFPMVKLGELYEVPKTIKKFNSGDMDNRGDSAFFNGKWDCPVGTHSEHSFTSDIDYFVIIKDGGGDHTSSKVGMGKFFKVNGKCSVTSHNVILVQKKENVITHEYVYYYMTLNAKNLRDKARYSINLGSISMGDIMDFPIQLPPLPIQQEIVATLDRIYNPGTTELADTLKMTDKAMDLVLANPAGATLEPIVEAQRLIRKSAQMVADVKSQMVAIMKSVVNPRFPMMKLEDVCEYSNGKTLASSDKTEDGEYDVMGGGMKYIGKTSKYNREGETVSISKSGYAGFVAYHNKKYWAGDCLTLVTNDDARMTTRYLYYFLKLNSHLTMSKASGSTIPHCKWDDIKNILIAVPPRIIQVDVLTRLEALQSQVTALEALQKQSEDNARFILESYIAPALGAGLDVITLEE